MGATNRKRTEETRSIITIIYTFLNKFDYSGYNGNHDSANSGLSVY